MRISSTLVGTLLHRDSNVSRLCTISGTAQQAIKGRIRDLGGIIASLDQGIREAEAAERDERFYGRAIVVAELTVAACDLFMEIVSVSTPVGKGIKAVYEQKQTMAELGAGKLDGAKATTRMLKGASGLAPWGAGAKVVTKVATATADTAIDGYRGRLTAKKAVLGSIDKNLALLEFALISEGKARAGSVVRTGKALVGASVKLVDAFSAPGWENAGKRTLIQQSRDLKQRLAQLNAQLVGCEEIVIP